MTDVVRFGVSIPAKLVKSFDESIRGKGYRNRSEAIRDIMRDHLVDSEWGGESPDEVVGTVTIVYDHEVRDLSSALTSLQHESHDAIVCTTHIHLDEHNCLEVIVVRGRGDEIRAIADKLISTRGVKHGKLVCTTTGKRLV
jgi:CopG family nickel-responsive transcriptional regulator